MIDKSVDNREATLSTTYRVRDKTCVFLHTNSILKSSKEKIVRLKRKVVRKSKISGPKELSTASTTRTIRDSNAVSMPFGDQKCSLCHNNKRIKMCSECGCKKCLKKTGDPLVSIKHSSFFS